MGTLNPNDQFLVNDSSDNFKSKTVTQANLMAKLEDDDLMLVNRDVNGVETSFKATGLDIKTSLVDPIVITSVTLSDTTPSVNDTISVVVQATGGKNPVQTYQWKSDDVGIAGATNQTYTVLVADLNKRISCTVTITDDLGSTTSATTAQSDPVQSNETVDQPTLLTPPNNAGLGPATEIPTTDSLSSVSTTSTTTTVVASGDTDLNILEQGDATMTNATGTVITYSPLSSTITDVDVAYSGGYNSSQDWSDGMPDSSYGDPVANAFNGGLDTYVRTTNTTAGNQFTSQSFTVENTFEVYISGSQSKDYPTYVIISGTPYTSAPPSSNYQGWITINVPPGTYNNFSIASYNSGNAPSSVYIGAIRIDGKIFVDSSLINQSKNWSELVSVDQQIFSDNIVSNAFELKTDFSYAALNGAPKCVVESSNTSSSPSTITIDNLNIDVQSEIKLYTERIGTITLTIDGSETSQSYDNSNIILPVTFTQTTGTLSKIVMAGTYTDSDLVYLYALVVDDKQLVDPLAGTTVVGTELTLTDNQDLKYFLPGDVVQGPNWNQSAVWSSEGTIVNPVNDSIGIDHPAYNPVNLYDGNLNTSWGTTSITVKSQTGMSIPFTTSLKVLINSNVDSGVLTFTGANGSTGTIDLSTDGWVNGTTNTLYTVQGNLQSPATGFTWPGAGAGGMYLIGIYADNALLVNSGIVYTGDDAVKVVSVVAANNKMVVDGGKWGGANSSQVWSDDASTTGTLQAGTTFEDAFDANPNTFLYTDGDITVTTAFGPVTSVGVSDTGNSQSREVLVNGVSVGSMPADTSGQLRTVTFAFTEVNATSITIQAGNLNALYELYVNSEFLVDGPWNQSEVWSANPTGNFTGTAVKGFNGIVNNSDYAQAQYDATQDYYYTFGSYTYPGIANTTTVEFDTQSGSGIIENTFYVVADDGTQYTVAGNANNGTIRAANAKLTVPDKTIVKMGMTTSIGSTVALWGGVYVNNTLLVDKGIGGDTKVTGPANTGTGKVSTVDKATKTITVTGSNDRWISSGAWNTTTQQGNAAGTDFYLTGDEVTAVVVNPDDIHMTCTAFSGNNAAYGSTTWQITNDADTTFQSPIINVTNNNETFYNVSTIIPETDSILTVSGSGTSGSPYLLTLDGDEDLTYFDTGEIVLSISSVTVTGTVVSVDTTANTLSLTASDDWTNTVGSKVIGQPGSGLDANTIYRAQVRQTSNNNIESSFSTTNRFKTASAADKGMHGLRFDGQRETYLNRTLTAPSSGWTISYWIKPTTIANGYVMNIRPSGGSDEIVMAIANLVIQCNYFNSTRINITTVQNSWQHIVYSSDGSQIKAYKDGDLIGTSSVTASDLDGTYYIGKSFSSSGFFNGYLSEYYFVEGALGPTVFGESINNGTWIPKDDDAISTAITSAGGFGTNGFYLPFDPDAVGANYSANTTITGNTSGNAAMLFNGLLSGDQAVGSTNTTTFEFSPPLPAGTLSFFVDSANCDVTVNDSINEDIGLGAETAQVKPFGAVPAVTKITLNNSGSYIRGIYIDNILLVDHNNIGVDYSGNNNDFLDENFAVGNTSQVWSQNNTGFAKPALQAFDGNLTTVASATDGANNECAVTFTGISASKIEVYISGQTSAASEDCQWFASTSGGRKAFTYPASGDPNGWLTVYDGTQLTVTGLGSKRNSSSNGSATYAWRIDGKLLIDANIQDTVVDTPIKNYAVLTEGENGNLEQETSVSGYSATAATQEISSKKYYWEVTPTDLAGNLEIGISDKDSFTSSESVGSANGWAILSNGNKIHDNILTTYGTALNVGDTVGVLYDADTYVLSFAINGVSYGPAYTAGDITGTNKYPAVSDSSSSQSSSYIINFGQQPFAYATNNMNGTATVDGKLFQLLFDPIVQSTQLTVGDFYYDINRNELTTSLEVQNRYGLLLKDFASSGIRALTGALANRLR